MFYYIIYNMEVRAEIPLAGFPEGGAGRDVTIRLGEELPRDREMPPDGLIPGSSADEVHLSSRRLGRFLIKGGREIVIELGRSVDRRLLAFYLECVPLGIICYQRGWLTLHASCVTMGGAAVAFLGISGSGKSTTAAAIHSLGHGIVSDDRLVLDLSRLRPEVLPAMPELHLCPDSAARLGADAEELPPVHSSEIKRVYRRAGGILGGPVPLAAVYTLEYDRSDLRAEPLPPVEAFRALVENTQGLDFIHAAGLASRHLEQCARLVRSVPFHRLVRPRSLGNLPELVPFIEGHAARLVGRSGARGR